MRVLVVDDGSSDDTAHLAFSSGAAVIRHKQNKGLGQAFRSAVDYAIDHGYDLMVNMDGDGQFDPDDIARLIAPLVNQEADFVTASRFLRGDNIPHMPPVKRWGNARMNSLISRFWAEVFLCELRLSRLQPRDAPQDQLLRPLHLHPGIIYLLSFP